MTHLWAERKKLPIHEIIIYTEKLMTVYFKIFGVFDMLISSTYFTINLIRYTKIQKLDFYFFETDASRYCDGKQAFNNKFK